MSIPPNPPTEYLYEVTRESLKKGDTLYIYDTYYSKWHPVTFIGVDDWGPGLQFIKFQTTDGQIKNYMFEQINDGTLRIFKKDVVKESLQNKFMRQKMKVLENSPLGFEGPPMNLIGKFIGLKKIPGKGGRRKTRRSRNRKSRRSRKN